MFGAQITFLWQVLDYEGNRWRILGAAPEYVQYTDFVTKQRYHTTGYSTADGLGSYFATRQTVDCPRLAKCFRGAQTAIPALFQQETRTEDHTGFDFLGTLNCHSYCCNHTCLKALHENHLGIAAMKKTAWSLFLLPNVAAETERLVWACAVCIEAAPMPRRHMPVPWPVLNKRWSCLHLDFAGPLDVHMILVAVDAITQWIEAPPLRSATSETTVDALRVIFARFSLLRTAVTDNGTQFTSAFFWDLMDRNQIQHLTVAPYHPQSNGSAERAVRTVKEGLKKTRLTITDKAHQIRLTRMWTVYSWMH